MCREMMIGNRVLQGVQSVGATSILVLLDEDLIHTSYGGAMVCNGFTDFIIVDIRALNDYFDGLGLGIDFNNGNVDFFDSGNLADHG